MIPNFYIYADPDLAALPYGVTMICLRRELKEDEKKRYTEATKNKEWEKIEEYLEKLEEDEDIVYQHETIDVAEINVRGLDSVLKRRVEIYIPQFILKTRVKPACIYRNSKCPVSLHYKMEMVGSSSCVELRIARDISVVKRRWLILNHWHKSYPQYNWNENLGLPTLQQSLTCLQYGINYKYHYWEYLKTIPKVWLHVLKKYDMDFYFGRNYLNDPPEWWVKIFDCPFDAYLSEKDKQLLRTLVKGEYKGSDFKFFLERYPSIQNPKYITANEWDWLIP